VRLFDGDVADLRVVMGFQVNVAPDSRVGELRTPVPAKHRTAFADVDVAFDGVFDSEQRIRQLTIFFTDVIQTRMQDDVDRVRAFKQILGDGEAIRPVHVVGTGDDLII